MGVGAGGRLWPAHPPTCSPTEIGRPLPRGRLLAGFGWSPTHHSTKQNILLRPLHQGPQPQIAPNHVPMLAPPPKTKPPAGGVGKWCSPQGPVSSEVSTAQGAHQGLRSLQCSWGREMLSKLQDLPSVRTVPAGLALCAAPHVPLWVSQGAPHTTCPAYTPVHPSGVQSWAGGSRRPPDPQSPPAALE